MEVVTIRPAAVQCTPAVSDGDTLNKLAGLACAAFAAHIDLVEVVAGARLIKPKLFPAAAGATVHKAAPVHIAEVAVGAALHKAHRHHSNKRRRDPWDTLYLYSRAWPR